MNSYDVIIPSTDTMYYEETEWKIVLVLLGIYLGCMALALAQYVLSSLSLYTIADKRKISSPILAWFPFGFQWILGSLADFFDAKKGHKATWAKTLLLFTVFPIAGIVIFYVVLFLFGFVFGLMSALGGEEPTVAMILGIVLTYLFLVAMLTVAMGASVVQYVCLYKIYEALVPEKRVKYLVISVIVPFGQAICLFRCRNSTVGMEDEVPPPAPPVSPVLQETAPKSETNPNAF